MRIQFQFVSEHPLKFIRGKAAPAKDVKVIIIREQASGSFMLSQPNPNLRVGKQKFLSILSFMKLLIDQKELQELKDQATEEKRCSIASKASKKIVG